MKRFPLLPQLALVFAVIYACSDTTTPADSRSLMIPKDPSLGLRGDPPPPPVDAAIVVCTGGVCVLLDGTYMSNGAVASNGRRATTFAFAVAIAANAPGQGVCDFPGGSWLNFNNKQDPQGHDLMASANGRIKCSHGRASGNGTIEYQSSSGLVVVDLNGVDPINNPPDCSTFCGSFDAPATVDGEPVEGGAHGSVFNRAFFDEFCSFGSGGAECGGNEG